MVVHFLPLKIKEQYKQIYLKQYNSVSTIFKAKKYKRTSKEITGNPFKTSYINP